MKAQAGCMKNLSRLKKWVLATLNLSTLELPTAADLKLQLLSSGVLTPVKPGWNLRDRKRGRNLHYLVLIGLFWADGVIPENRTESGSRKSILTFDSEFIHNDLGWSLDSGEADEGYAFAIHPSGRIISVGKAFNGKDDDFAIAVHDSSGKLDKTFGKDGKVTTDFGGLNDSAYAVAVYPDGLIVVGGRSCTAWQHCWVSMARIFPNGKLDRSFGEGGKVRTQLGGALPAYYPSFSLDERGRIFISGYQCPNQNYCFYAEANYSNDGRLTRPLKKTLVAASALHPTAPYQKTPQLAGPFLNSLPKHGAKRR